jgi:hypothetical protein
LLHTIIHDEHYILSSSEPVLRIGTGTLEIRLCIAPANLSSASKKVEIRISIGAGKMGIHMVMAVWQGSAFDPTVIGSDTLGPKSTSPAESNYDISWKPR